MDLLVAAVAYVDVDVDAVAMASRPFLEDFQKHVDSLSATDFSPAPKFRATIRVSIRRFLAVSNGNRV